MNKNLVMQEKELIAKIKELRRIKPNQEWVFLTKNRILGQEQEAKLPSVGYSLGEVLRGLFFRPVLKPAYATLLALLVIFGLFGFAQNSLPGDYLYPIKRITETGQTLFASAEEREQINLELIEKRLGELTKIVEENKTKKLAPAIREFQTAVSEAVPGADQESLKKVVEIRNRTAELQTRGVVIEGDEVQKLGMGPLVGILEEMIADLENRSLTTKQELVLDRMKELVAEGRYLDAIELYWRNQ